MSTGYSYLMPGSLLAQGSVPPPGARVPFDVIVLAAVEHQDVPLPGYEVIRVPLDDSGPPPSPADRALIRETAKRIARRVRAGKCVLVTCHQGRNRSGVLTGLALVELGLPRERAVRRIQQYRDGLTNPYFQSNGRWYSLRGDKPWRTTRDHPDRVRRYRRSCGRTGSGALRPRRTAWRSPSAS